MTVYAAFDIDGRRHTGEPHCGFATLLVQGGSGANHSHGRALMAKLAIILAIVGLAYWYWSGSHQDAAQTSEADRLQDNAVTMQRCIKQEERMQAAGGVAGLGDVGSTGADAERVCAEKNNLYLRDGNWYSNED